MNTPPPLPPVHFWSLLALCLLAFAALWWFVLAAGRVARRRELRRRIEALDVAGTPPAPLDLAGMQQAIAQARRATQHTPAPQGLRRSAYATPWFMFIGDAEANVSGLLDAAAEASSAPAAAVPAPADGDPFWHWRFLRSAIAIEIHPAALGEPADRRERSRWYRALLELAERRERLPLNGIVACVAAASLLGDAQAAAAAATRMRELIDDAASRLRLQFPVYLLVTGLERLDGYALVRAALPPETVEQAVGHRLATPADAGAAAGPRLDALLEELHLRMSALRMALFRGQSQPAQRLATHRFVEQLCGLQPALRAVIERLFREGRELRPRWRGIYFTAASSDAGRGAFLADLFGHFLPADQPLAAEISRRRARGAGP